MTAWCPVRQGRSRMKAERTDPTRRRPIRWGTVGLSCVLSPVAGYVAVGQPRRALYLMGAAVVYLGLAAAAALLRLPFVLYGVLVVSLVHTIVAIFDVGRLSRTGKGPVLWSRGVGAGLGALAFTAGLLLAVGRFVVEPIKCSPSPCSPRWRRATCSSSTSSAARWGAATSSSFITRPIPASSTSSGWWRSGGTTSTSTRASSCSTPARPTASGWGSSSGWIRSWASTPSSAGARQSTASPTRSTGGPAPWRSGTARTSPRATSS